MPFTATTPQVRPGTEQELAFGGKTESLADVAHLIFGHLVKLAQPYVERYHSDLYHDAMWICRNVPGTACSFWFGADSDGTAIGTVAALVAGGRQNAWRIDCEIRPDRHGYATAYITVSEVIR